MSPPMSVFRLVRAALHGGQRMTVAELAVATGLMRATIQKVLNANVCFAVVAKRAGGNKPALVWALDGTAPAMSQAAQLLGPDGAGRGDVPDAEGVSNGVHDYRAVQSSIVFVPSDERVTCPTIGAVTLPACVDGYVADTARRRGPCDSCTIGRARRAAWAGADFEDELDDGDSDSLDLR